METDKAEIVKSQFTRNTGNLLKLKNQYGNDVKLLFVLDHPDGRKDTYQATEGRFFSKSITMGYRGPMYEEMANWILLERLCDIVLFYRPFCIVEIGAGESTEILARIAEKAKVKFYSCDIKEEKRKNLFPDHVFFLGNSDKFIEWFDDTPAIVLIDGNHSYEQSKKEFEFFFEKLIEGGIIFLHDTYPPAEIYLQKGACDDAYRLRQELEKRTEEMDVFTWPYTSKWMGLTMVIKKEKKRPYWGK